MWKIIDTGKNSAIKNMELDAEFLRELSPQDNPILHLYEWQRPSGTYGFFIDPSRFLNLQQCQLLNFDLARRPTGGGIVFHVSDFAFSVLIPAGCPFYSLRTLDNYYFINNRVKKALNYFFKDSPSLLLAEEEEPLDKMCPYFCMARPTQFDVMVEGKKIAGGAQRQRKKRGYLHQGSIAIALPKESFLQALLLPGTSVEAAMQKNTFALLHSDWTHSDLEEARIQIRRLLIKAFSEDEK